MSLPGIQQKNFQKGTILCKGPEAGVSPVAGEEPQAVLQSQISAGQSRLISKHPSDCALGYQPPRGWAGPDPPYITNATESLQGRKWGRQNDPQGNVQIRDRSMNS